MVNAIEKLIDRMILQTEIEMLNRLKELVYNLNQKLNLTRIPENVFMDRHVVDSLLLNPFLHTLKPQSVLDFGTGAGFPGLPLAIFNSKVKFFLFDKSRKKAEAVKKIIRSLGLENVIFVEKVLTCDLIISRAVAKTQELINITKNLFKIAGLAIKSKSCLDELKSFNTNLLCQVFAHNIDYPYESVILVYSNKPLMLNPKLFQRIWANNPFRYSEGGNPNKYG